MIPDFYTFQEIIRYNANDWNQAYEVLQCYLQNGSFKKEIRGPENIIYHNLGKVKPFNLMYERVFFKEKSETHIRRPRMKVQNLPK
ncbi:hypothetical protein [Algoriphagus mannitolivorans]|uniref:hypothetical protein n=1 Tax=Algoriphagus mannitolivorans TaxID=226504 RepID=UPI000415BF6C|nr:hypothetical protein [Algoriphagus mannitolivorans]